MLGSVDVLCLAGIFYYKRDASNYRGDGIMPSVEKTTLEP